MAWEVIEYMDNNPQATPKDVIGYFAEKLEINNQLEYLQEEVNKVLEIREVLRPLYGKKMNLDSNLALLDSDFDMEVMTQYPPRKGSDADRKALKAKLQSTHADYPKLKVELEKTKEQISLHEEEMSDVQQRAKNARRLLETFNHYMAFVTNSTVAISHVARAEATNVDVF